RKAETARNPDRRREPEPNRDPVWVLERKPVPAAERVASGEYRRRLGDHRAAGCRASRSGWHVPPHAPAQGGSRGTSFARGPTRAGGRPGWGETGRRRGGAGGGGGAPAGGAAGHAGGGAHHD